MISYFLYTGIFAAGSPSSSSTRCFDYAIFYYVPQVILATEDQLEGPKSYHQLGVLLRNL